MSDENIDDLLKGLEEAEAAAGISVPETGETDDAESTPITAPTSASDLDRPGARSRLFGLMALLLGVVGALLALVVAVLMIRFGFGVSGTIDRVMEPIEVAFDRMEARIDQTDDLVDREGLQSDRIDQLQARVDGLVDVTTGAHQGFEAIEDHPVYGLLPAELSTLGDALAGFESSSVEIDELLGDAGNGDTVSAAVSNQVAERIDDMQGRVTGVRDDIDAAADSLKRWTRFGAFLGFLGSLWGFWGQLSLARRGWRGFRGRPL